MKKYTMIIKEKVNGEYIVREVHKTNSKKQIEKWWVKYAYTGNDMSVKGFNSTYKVINNETGHDIILL